MGRMKELQMDMDELEREGLTLPAFPPLKPEPEQIDQAFEDEDWEHLKPGTDDEFADGCGPDFESSECLFPDRPVALVREQLRYADNGAVLRSRVARLTPLRNQGPLPLSAFIPTLAHFESGKNEPETVAQKERTCHAS